MIPRSRRPRSAVDACRRTAPMALALLALALGGCAGAPPAPPAAGLDLPEAFSLGGDDALHSQWWLAFDDPALAALVAEALSGSYSLQSAAARLRQAEAVAAREHAARVPALNLEAGRTRRDASFGDAPAAVSDDTTLGLAASWEVDLWGRVRAASDAAALDAAVAAHEFDVAALSLTAEVARTWYQLAERRAQLDLLDEQLASNEQVAELVTFRFRQGQAQAADVLRQRQALEAVQGQRAQALLAATTLEHQLEVLAGRPPGRGIDAGVALTELPPLPVTGVPLEAMQQRPDVRQAWLDVAAADRRVAVALAARWPRLSLSASTATRDTALFNDWITTLTANLVLPLIDGGNRRAEVRRSEAVAEQRLADYRQTLLGALREVEDALVGEVGQRAHLDSLDRQLAQSAVIVDNLRVRYSQGAVNYLDVLDALLTRQSLQRERLTAQRQLIEYRINLYRALAGVPGDGDGRLAWTTDVPQ